MKIFNKILSVVLCLMMIIGIIAINPEMFSINAFSASENYKVGDIIWYGSYPQSRITNSNLIQQLNSQSGTWQSYKYYTGNDSICVDNWNTVSGDWMRYKDIVFNNKKFRAVVFDSYRPIYTFEESKAERSFQDDNGYTTGNIYWFEFEPIKWRVLDPLSGFIMCDSIIDSQPYCNFVYHTAEFLDKNLPFEAYNDISLTTGCADYRTSSIRMWLNDDFIETAFSAFEFLNIKTTSVINHVFNGDDYITKDRVFLLSEDELTNSAYGFSPNDNKKRIMYGTDYALCQGLGFNNNDSGYGSSWLKRNESSTTSYTASITESGNLFHICLLDVAVSSNGVVPAMCLKELKSECPKFYYTNGDENGTHDFTYHNVEKYICEKPSTEYDPRMAAFAATMANAASSEYNLKKTFEELDIPEDDYKLYHYDGYGLFDSMSTAFSIAHQKTVDGKTIIFVTLRGTRDPSQGVGEWMDNIISNMNPFSDGTGPHMGFKRCCDDAFDRLKEYEQSLGNTTNVNYTYVITGHSRGAAAANLLAVKLMDERSIKKSNLFCYTIACPDSAANYLDDWSNYSKSNKYNNIFNINNVKDPVPYVPGTAGDLLCNIWNTPSSFVKSLFGGKADMVRWDKYGISMWYSWDWTDDRQVSIDIRPNGNNVHNQYEYWRYLSTLKTDFKDRNSTQALASGLAEALGNLISIRCPVDVFITDKTGKNIASVIDGKTNYYDSEVGEVLIFVRGDQKAVYLGKENDYNIKLVATDSGKMRVDLLRINPFTSEIDVDNYAKFENVSLVQGKAMVAELSKDKLPQDVKLFVVDESTGDKKTVINSDGSEAEYNDSLNNVNIYVGKATTVDEKSNLIFEYRIENIPQGYGVKTELFRNGVCINSDITYDIGNGTYIYGTMGLNKVSPATITYKAGICDKDGNYVVYDGKAISKESGEITVKRAGFFKRIILFFKGLFNKLPTVEIRSGY